jgi:serine/threonine-protein kinase
VETSKIEAEFGVTADTARRALEESRRTGRPVAEILRRPAPSRFGKYEILETLGQGGGGTVYRVRNPSLGRIEALKVLREDKDTSPEDHARFEREARVLAQLSHPNIVPVYEVGAQEGRPFYTMEFVPGESLAGVIKRMGALPPRAAMIVGRDAARALAAAPRASSACSSPTSAWRASSASRA